MAGMLIKGSPSHFFQTDLPSGVRISSSQLSVLNATYPSATTAAVGPSSLVRYCQSILPVLGVECIELVAAEAATDEEFPVDDCRGGQGMVAGNCHFPAFSLAVLAGEGLRGRDLGSWAGPLNDLLSSAERIVGGGLVCGRGLHGRVFHLNFARIYVLGLGQTGHKPRQSYEHAQNRQKTYTLRTMTHLLF